jgi:hypothetical protein
MLNATGSQIAEQLCCVFITQRPARFDLNDEATFDKQISVKVTEQKAINIINRQGELLLDFETQFS